MRINALPTLPTLSSSVAYKSSTYLATCADSGCHARRAEWKSVCYLQRIYFGRRSSHSQCMYNALATSNWLWSCFHVPVFIHIATQKIRTKKQFGLERVYRFHVVFFFFLAFWYRNLFHRLWVNVLVGTRNQNRLSEWYSCFLMLTEMHDEHLEEVEIWSRRPTKNANHQFPIAPSNKRVRCRTRESRPLGRIAPANKQRPKRRRHTHPQQKETDRIIASLDNVLMKIYSPSHGRQ